MELGREAVTERALCWSGDGGNETQIPWNDRRRAWSGSDDRCGVQHFWTLRTCAGHFIPSLLRAVHSFSVVLLVEQKAGVAGAVQAACNRNGMLILTTGIYDTLVSLSSIHTSGCCAI
jgi:hypothetical protein